MGANDGERGSEEQEVFVVGHGSEARKFVAVEDGNWGCLPRSLTVQGGWHAVCTDATKI